MLADASLGLFVLATPNGTHFPLAKELLKAGKNVVVDKPMTLTSAEAAELIGLARKHKALLAPFHNRRWDSDFLTIQKLLHEGSLGRLVAFESRLDRWRPAPLTERMWKESAEAGGGKLLDLGPHLADQALVLFGKPEGVSAEVVREKDGPGVNDAFTIRLRYPGLAVTLGANSLSLPAPPRFYLRGTKGSYWKSGVDPQEAALNKITRIDTRTGTRPGARSRRPTGACCMWASKAARSADPFPRSRETTGSTTRAFATRCWGKLPRQSPASTAGAWRGCWSGPWRAPKSAARSCATGAASRSEVPAGGKIAAYCRLGSFSISGTQKRNRAPLPGTLEASMPPPWALSMARVIASPIPDPLRSLAPRLPAIELLKDQRQILGVDAGAVVFHAELQSLLCAFAAQRDARAGRRVGGYVFQ